MEQILKVVTDQWDEDGHGNAWQIHYILYAVDDHFELWEDDGEGNGILIFTGNHKHRCIGVALRLGKQLEWKAGVPLR